ncbi:MAG TPA: hypothetical protein VKB93_16790 [Thermoanaerobaculia bacterium]|nr:hypothetical protein [Thermoanaerobaculia bacterium]
MAIGAVPSVMVFLVFQFAVTDAAMTRMCQTAPSAMTRHDLAPLVNYYISWVAHLTVSIGVAYGARRGALHASEAKAPFLIQFPLAVCLLIVALVLAADSLHTKMAVLSHERLFSVMSAEPSLAPLFRGEAEIPNFTLSIFPIIGVATPIWTPTLTLSFPTWFSLFPIVGVATALWTTCVVIMCASKFLVTFTAQDVNSPEVDPRAKLTASIEALRTHMLALSLVLVTSTLGTIAYLRIPLGLLADGPRSEFKSISDSVGLAWGVMFSLILVALCLYPLIVLREQFDTLRAQTEHTKNKLMEKWIDENRLLLQVPTNLQLLLSIVSPAAVAVVSNLVST